MYVNIILMYHKADKESGQNYAEFIWHGYITKPNTYQTHKIPNLIVNINNYLLYLQLDLDTWIIPCQQYLERKKKAFAWPHMHTAIWTHHIQLWLEYVVQLCIQLMLIICTDNFDIKSFKTKLASTVWKKAVFVVVYVGTNAHVIIWMHPTRLMWLE